MKNWKIVNFHTLTLQMLEPVTFHLLAVREVLHKLILDCVDWDVTANLCNFMLQLLKDTGWILVNYNIQASPQEFCKYVLNLKNGEASKR